MTVRRAGHLLLSLFRYGDQASVPRPMGSWVASRKRTGPARIWPISAAGSHLRPRVRLRIAVVSLGWIRRWCGCPTWPPALCADGDTAAVPGAETRHHRQRRHWSPGSSRRCGGWATSASPPAASHSVTVTRTGRSISRARRSQSALAAHLIFLGHAEQGALVRCAAGPGGQRFPRGAVRRPVRCAMLKLDAKSRPHAASARLVTVEGSQLAAAGIRVSGFAEELIEVPTLARPVNRGETISPTDVILTPMPLSKIGQDTIMRIDEVAGMAARRAMRADRMVSSGDLMRPLLVRKDDLVSIIYRHSGLTLTVRGRARQSRGGRRRHQRPESSVKTHAPGRHRARRRCDRQSDQRPDGRTEQPIGPTMTGPIQQDCASHA
jgi:flagella basal body P-ring formation protein FlgA